MMLEANIFSTTKNPVKLGQSRRLQSTAKWKNVKVGHNYTELYHILQWQWIKHTLLN